MANSANAIRDFRYRRTRNNAPNLLGLSTSALRKRHEADASAKLDIYCVTFFLYLCGVYAFKSEALFDNLFERASFIAYATCSFYSLVRNERSRNTPNKVFTIATLWFVALWTYIILSVFWSANLEYALHTRYIQNAIQVVVVITFLIYQVDSIEKFLMYLKAFVLANLFCVVWLLTITPLSDWGTERIGAPIGVTHNLVGMRCAIAAFASYYLYRSTERKRFLVCIAPFMAIIAFTGSRKAFLMLFVLLAALLMFSSRKGFMFDRFIAVLILGIALLAAVLLIPPFYDILGKRLVRLFDYYLANGAGGISENERAYYRNYALNMWLDRPLFGWGFNQFAATMDLIGYSHIAYSHCNYTELLSCLGVVGVIVYYSAYVYIIHALILKRPRNNCVAYFGLILVLVLAVFDYGWVSFVTIDIYMWLAIAFLANRVCNKDSCRDSIRKSLLAQ